MADHPITLGATNVTLTAVVGDTVTMTNGGSAEINVVTATGLNPQGSNKLEPGASKQYTVTAFPAGNDPKITFNWNETGARAPRTGTINPG